MDKSFDEITFLMEKIFSLLVLLVFLEFTIHKKERKRNEEGTNVPFEK